jgi:AraC-like DNA-binding protein
VLLTSLLVDAFADLGIGVSVWAGDVWRAIHLSASSVIDSELEHGLTSVRSAYNLRCRERVRQSRSVVLGEHAGFHDLFVPIHDEEALQAILVAGPFARTRPSSTELLDRWHRLTSSQGRLTDPAFAAYVTRTLGTLTLEGPMLARFERLLSCVALLAEGRDTPEALATEALSLQSTLRAARFPEQMWEAARSMVDERTAHIWPSKSGTLSSLRMKRPPSSAIVGLLAANRDDVDPLEDLLRRDTFQRAAVDLAARLGDIVCGKVFDYAVTFLVDCGDSSARGRARLADLAARMASDARRFDIRLHAGIAPAAGSESLPMRFRTALASAEKAFTHRQRVAFAQTRPERSAGQLRRMREELAAGAAQRTDRLSRTFDGYIEAVLLHSGYHFETTRAHLEAGFERLMGPLLINGAFDQRTFDELYAEMERAAEAADTVNALIAPYRRLVAQMEQALERPTRANQSRGMLRALQFMREHLSEPLTRLQVARVAGFAPGHFSRLLRREQGHAFEIYLQRLRVTRAKQMLTGTVLSISRVGQLSGFPAQTYFHRVFKARVGVTPAEYRRQQEGARG